MIEHIEQIQQPLSPKVCYVEPRFTKTLVQEIQSLLINYQGLEFLPFFAQPQSMSMAKMLSKSLKAPLILTSRIEIDSFDEAFNVRQNPQLAHRYIIQFGLGEEELAYAKKMLGHKFRWFMLHAPHAASQVVIDQLIAFRLMAPDATLIVGDFYNLESLDHFASKLSELGAYRVDFWQVTIDEHPSGVQNLGLATLAKVRQAGYPVVASSQYFGAKELLLMLASGAKWMHVAKPMEQLLASNDQWQEQLEKELLELVNWLGLTSLDDVYDVVVVKRGNN